jgi:starch phosphorylase
MTVLALHLARYCNAVSELHADVTRRMWSAVYGCEPERVPIEHITNGVHTQTWLAPEAVPLYERYISPRWVGAGPEEPWWDRVDRIPDGALWALRAQLRRRLVAFVRQRLREQLLRAGAARDEVLRASDVLDENALTIGFARRFATYKRAPLIFRSPKRLSQILNDPDRPVQLIFAGKAHPADADGQAFVQQVVAESRRKQFRDRVVFIEDYDMHVGRMLTSGCDVWLNTPRRPFEASGTSGMKPPLHGGINCSVLDGWWPEAFDGTNGWEIGGGRELSSPEKQDAHDVRALYDLLERDLVPAFYDRDVDGPPQRWLETARASMRTICQRFNTHRMVGEYVERYYLEAHR